MLIYAEGIAPIKPVRLKGSVSFDFDASMTVVERKSANGVVVGEADRRLSSAAFAIIGRPADFHDVRAGARFTRRTGNPAVYDFAEGNHAFTWTDPSKEALDAASAMSFRLGSRNFLLIKWSSDFCGSSYTLFSVESALKPIAGNDYDCDP